MSNISYKEVPYDSPVRFDANGQPHMAVSPQLDLVDAIEEKPRPQPAPVPSPPRRPVPKAVSEVPVKGDTDQLVLAMHPMHTVVTERIAYHEAELRRLHEALKPFSDFAAAPAEGGAQTIEEETSEFLALAARLGKGAQT